MGELFKKMKPPFLRFEEIFTTGKTRIFEVYSVHSAELLGKIHWRNGWRHYVMSYADNIDMSVSCDDELNKFMHELENLPYITRQLNRKTWGNYLRR